MLLSPLFAAIALAIKLEDGGPVFYVQPRVGKDFRVFGLLKFRSMEPHADRRGGPLTVARDPRVTKVGRFLRRNKLDELPQFVNVLKGDMQLVGARPELQRYVEMFRSHYALILRDRPGITDPASLAYGHEEGLLDGAHWEELYVSQILPHKLEISLQHARRRTFLSDLAILLRTAARIHSGPDECRQTKPP